MNDVDCNENKDNVLIEKDRIINLNMCDFKKLRGQKLIKGDYQEKK